MISAKLASLQPLPRTELWPWAMVIPYFRVGWSAKAGGFGIMGSLDLLAVPKKPIFLSHPWPLGRSVPSLSLCLTREFPPSFPDTAAKLEFGTSSGVKTRPKGWGYRVKAQERSLNRGCFGKMGLVQLQILGCILRVEQTKRLLPRSLGARVEQLGLRRIGNQNGQPASHSSWDKAFRVLIHFLFTLPGGHLWEQCQSNVKSVI